MGVTLYQHNVDAYVEASWMLRKTKRAAIVHPTGTGKAFIGFRLCEDHAKERICWLSPSESIFETQKENWKRAGGGDLGNITFLTYAKLMITPGEDVNDIKPDYIILDEFHRCGARAWGKGVQRLMRANRNVPVLGLSATAIRYLDNQRNMADELFHGNVASELTLGDAIVRGILNPPRYVLGLYRYKTLLKDCEEHIRITKSKAARDAAEKELEALRRAIDKADDMDVVFERHMSDRHGKYIVFCSGVGHLNEMVEKVSEWFGRIDAEPHVYKVYSDDALASDDFRNFKEDHSDHLRLLYCIDMLNEGVHVTDISGVILLRPTVSPIIYKQQIGRALSADKEHVPVIFDIVMNINNLYSIGVIEEEMKTAIDRCVSDGREKEVINTRFQVIDEVKDCRKLFQRLNESLSASWDIMYELAAQYYEEHGNLNVPVHYATEEGYTLGSWLATQRRVRRGKSYGILTAEQIRKLDAIGMRWREAKAISWDKYYKAAKEYYAEHGDLLVPVTLPEYHGLDLAAWIASQRANRKRARGHSWLTEERINALDKLGMVWDVNGEKWEQYTQALGKYKEENGDVDVPTNYITKDGIKLGAWLARLRSYHRAPYLYHALTEAKKKELEAIGVTFDSLLDTTWLKYFHDVEEYKAEHGDLKIPVAYVSGTGRRIGVWIRNQRNNYGKCLTNEHERLLSELGMVWQKEDPWKEKIDLLKAYYAEHGNVNMPADYQVNGVWLARWLSTQRARMDGKVDPKMHKQIQLTEDQIRDLESLGLKKGVSRLDEMWLENFEEVKQYLEENNATEIPDGTKGRNGKNLKCWVIRQKKYLKNNIQLKDEQIKKLAEIGIVGR